MRLAFRAFLWSFVPFALLLVSAFWGIQKKVVSTVRDGLRSSLREEQVSIARMRARSERENSRSLRIVGENATLKAGIQLLRADPLSLEARRTVEDQLRDISEAAGFDFLALSNTEGAAMAGVMRLGEQLVAMDTAHMPPLQGGFYSIGDRIFQFVSIPVDQGDEHLANLSVGEHFDLSEFTTPAVFTRNGSVLLTNVHNVAPSEIQQEMKKCGDQSECEIRLRGETYLSLPMDSISFGGGYLLRTLQSIDMASASVQAILREVFLVAAVGGLLAALILSIFSSRSVVRPISRIVAHLEECRRTGVLPEFADDQNPILEIHLLTAAFNEAASAIRDGSDKLRRAYVEFVGSLASALDARDPYTAGHSHRVSHFSCSIAEVMGLKGETLEEIRTGALLHDIGKIGISDRVLQKAGRLTEEEYALIQQHTTIGRRILEGVQGFEKYLNVVELHHENWDGSGYPRGLRGDSTPLCARIVHVADVYDAITSDRPYRNAMAHSEAVALITECAGTQFDSAIVAAFLKSTVVRARTPISVRVEDPETQSLRRLAEAVESEHAIDIETESRKA